MPLYARGARPQYTAKCEKRRGEEKKKKKKKKKKKRRGKKKKRGKKEKKEKEERGSNDFCSTTSYLKKLSASEKNRPGFRFLLLLPCPRRRRAEREVRDSLRHADYATRAPKLVVQFV